MKMQKMFKHAALMLAAAVGAIAFVATATDYVMPNTVALSCKRGTSETTLSGNFYKGTQMLLTNCQCFADSTGATTQGLSGVTVQVVIGAVGYTTTYTAAVVNAAAGTWALAAAVPTNTVSPLYMQVQIIDAATNSYIYPWFYFSTLSPLQ